MSSSPIGLTSTTPSSTSCSSLPESALPDSAPVAVIGCGALGAHIREIAARRGWQIELHLLPALLHNRPERIAPAAQDLALRLQGRGLRVVLAYADCGSYGALDQLCARLGLQRLAGLHCYDVFGGADRLRAELESQPGTYLLTDYLVRSFRRTVLAELGLDRHPELWPDYFGHYRRLVWLAQASAAAPDGPAADRAALDRAALDREAAAIAAMFGLPLTVLDVGTVGLERELERLVTGAAPPALAADIAPERRRIRKLAGFQNRSCRAPQFPSANMTEMGFLSIGPAMAVQSAHSPRCRFLCPDLAGTRHAPVW